MEFFDRADQFFRRDLWVTDLSTLPRLRRLGLQALRLTIAVAVEFRYRLFDARAAGLVYTTLLSMVPFLAVTFSVLKAFGAHRMVEPVLAETLAPLGEKGQEITTTVISFVNDLNVGVLGVVGVAALFVTAYSLISKVETAFNAIWHVRHARALTRKFSDYLSVVLVGPLLVVTAMALTASAQSYWLVQRVLEFEPFGSLAVWSARLMPFLLLFGAFTFLNKFMPNTRVRLASAAVGGITTAVLWNLAGAAFASFVATSARYSAIYSSFAILILFLIWLYVIWLVVLVGAQVAFFHQYPTTFTSHMLWRHASHVSREFLGLAMMRHVTRSHLGGSGPVSAADLASTAHAPASMVDELIEDFIRAGMLGRIEEPPGFTLMRPPEQVSLNDVLRVIDRRDTPGAETPADETNPVGRVLRRRDRAVESGLEGLTLRSLADPD